MACATSSSFAFITGAAAAIADPPQTEVPIPIKVVRFASNLKALPTKYATKKEEDSVKTSIIKDCPPTAITWKRFISNPNNIIEYCKIFLDVYFIPSSNFKNGIFEELFINIPTNMAKIGPPIRGKVFPNIHAGAAITKQSKIPGNTPLIFSIIF